MSKDLFPDDGARGQRTFRINVNRTQEITLQNELNNLAKKSIVEIEASKQAILQMPLKEGTETALKLKPNFKPQKRREKIKREPVFHDDLPAKPVTANPDHPFYNAMEREGAHIKMKVEKPKKYPMQKDELVTTEEVKKPHISSVGVVPVRESEAVDGLRVMMKGKPAGHIDTEKPGEPKTTPPVPRSAQSRSAPSRREVTIKEDEDKMDLAEDECTLPPTPKPYAFIEEEAEVKPPSMSIVGGIGTLAPVAYTQRPAPPAKPMTRLRRPKVFIPTDDTGPDGDRDSLDSGRNDGSRSQGSSAYTVKSSKDLLEEAKQIAGGTRKRKTSDSTYRSRSQSTGGTGANVSRQQSVSSQPIKPKVVERSVDEIIASLHDDSQNDVETEADLRIKEIMNRVVRRSQGVAEDAVLPPEKDGDTVEIVVSAAQKEEQEIAQPDQTEQSEQMKDALDKLSELRAGDGSTAGRATSDFTDSDMMDLDLGLYESEQDEETSRSKKKMPYVDLEQAWIDLNAPAEVSHEDVINITADKKMLHPKRDPTFIGSWAQAPTIEEEPDTTSEQPPPEKKKKNIHHFCTSDETVQLPDHMRGIWRKYHVPSKFDFLKPERNAEGKPSESPRKSLIPSPPGLGELSQHEALEIRQAQAARLILKEAHQLAQQDPDKEQQLQEWRSKAQRVFDLPEADVSRMKLEVKTDESFLHWHPAPPKWDVVPTKVKDILFPEYHGAALAQDFDPTVAGESDDSEIEEDRPTTIDSDLKEYKLRTLNRCHGSARDLTTLGREKMKTLEEQAVEMEEEAQQVEEDDKTFLTSLPGGGGGGAEPDRSNMTVQEIRAQMAAMTTPAPVIEEAPNAVRSKPSLFSRPLLPPIIPRPGSAPGNIGEDDDDFLMVYQDFSDAMVEVSAQRKQLKAFKAGKQTPPGQRAAKQAAEAAEAAEAADKIIEEELIGLTVTPGSSRSPHSSVRSPRSSLKSKSPNSRPKSSGGVGQLQQQQQPDPDDPNHHVLTAAEEALQAGRNYVILKAAKSKSRKMGKVDMKRIDDMEKFLAAEARPIKRSVSLPREHRVIERELRTPSWVRRRRNSLPDGLDYDKYKRRVPYMGELKNDDREWVRALWNRWFDQVFPPTPPTTEDEDEEEDDEDDFIDVPIIEQPVVEEEEDKSKRKGSLVYAPSDAEVYPVTAGPDDEEGVMLMEEEMERLTDEINASPGLPRAFDLCRRGAILRKLGKIKQAKQDLDGAISMEPMFLDAYWHRHLIFRLLNDKSAALDDLNYIIKYKKTHAGAYRSRAAICKEMNDLTMAVLNYSKAIQYAPDYDSYFQRALLYEARGEMLLAMEDYSQATKLSPDRTEALYKHAMHYFKNSNWSSAIDDFTELLRTEPFNAKARMFRGRASAMLKHWAPALQDYSAAIHLDPNNAKAFYYRGCLLRKLHPRKALEDFSVSLLLDDSEENHLAYLQRGILYNAIDKHEDAIPDFESCLRLDHQMACAHVNLGIIYMTKMDNHHRAIKKFTAAIKADPTYVKAYVCRAEAYTRIHEIKNALLDITRAIHLRPDVHHYYMYRGKLILQMGNLELAAFCVKHAAELNTGMAHSPTQEAIVQSFLKNYDKAIIALQNAVKSTPVPALYMLLGKTQMKAQKWSDAVASFQTALQLVTAAFEDQYQRKPWQDKQVWPAEAAEMYYLIGMCQVEERDYFNAHDAFNNAIKVNVKYSQAYYQRGLVRLRLKQNKGIQDFNRALAIDPKLFQAFLSRAAYYGMRKHFSKAILNCNEAIKLQPNSIRAFLYRGALKYHIKAFTLAIRDLTQAIAIDSKCTLAYFNRAVCYQDSGDAQKALQDYGIVLLLGDALKLRVLVNRGLLYYYHGDYANALFDLRMASQVYPHDKYIHHTLGLCYHKSEKLEEAVLSFTRALELDKFFLDALISRGNVFMDYGNDKGRSYARHDYERAVHLNPIYLPGRVNLAYTLQVAGKYMQAWHQFTAAIQIDPTYKPALEGRAIINLQMSDTFAAYQDINAACQVKPTAELLTNRGVIHQFMGHGVNAMRDYQAAIERDPKYSLAYFNAGNVCFHGRQFKQALRYYDSTLIYNRNDESALLNRAITRVLTKDAAGALKDFARAIKLSPYSAHMYFNRGNLYTSLEQFEKAQKDYTRSLYIQPDDPHVLTRRADVLGKLGIRDKAIEDYRRAIEIQSKKIISVPAQS